jgi:aryl-alcohol dehydrogenase-like predicted oxidoreductase
VHPPYNLLDRRIENEIVPMYQHFDMGILAWGPLAHGTLAGRHATATEFPEGSRTAHRPVYGDRISERGIQVGRKLVGLAKARRGSAVSPIRKS